MAYDKALLDSQEPDTIKALAVDLAEQLNTLRSWSRARNSQMARRLGLPYRADLGPAHTDGIVAWNVVKALDMARQAGLLV